MIIWSVFQYDAHIKDYIVWKRFLNSELFNRLFK